MSLLKYKGEEEKRKRTGENRGGERKERGETLIMGDRG